MTLTNRHGWYMTTCSIWILLVVGIHAESILPGWGYDTVTRESAPFGASVFIGGFWDLEPDIDGPGTPGRCEQALENIEEIGGIRKVQFTPTFFWDDVGPLDPPMGFDSSCSGADLNTYYCYNRFAATKVKHFCYQRDPNAKSCEEVTEEEMERFSTLFGRCVQKAVDMGFDIEVNVRVDDGKSLEGWRNTLLFDPLETYGSYSYETAILNPIADILGGLESYDGQLSMTVLGEMGATMFFYPTEWSLLLERMRERIDSKRPGLPKVKLGIQQNNSKFCGCYAVGFVGKHEEYMKMLADGFDPVSLGINLTAVKQLYRDADYLGISAYIPMTSATSIELCDYEGLLRRTDEELAFFDLSLEEITETTAIHYAETGIGGGAAQDGRTPARTANEAAFYPYWGIQGPHRCDLDPFKMCECDMVTGECGSPNPVRDYRRDFYQGFSDYLNNQGGCEYSNAIEVVYIWGTGSWDVLGVYTPDRSWMDPVVTEIIRNHNQDVV